MSTSSRIQRRQLSDILVDEGLVAREDVQEAVRIRKSTGETLGAILADMECLTPNDIAKVICIHYQLPFINLRNYDVDAKLAELFTPEFLHQHKIIPFDCIGQMLLLAVTEIPPEKSLAEIPQMTKRKVALYVAYMDEITKYLNEHCPLAQDSELLQRRRHVQPAKTTEQEIEGDVSALFGLDGGESLADALDSTWESIFDAVEQNRDEDKKG
ncbi:MAG: hypothetical protein O7J95_07785 [Planctomycetota bacterium]|nr:hypothetical protein [Planctomycetota bacterium]